MTTENAGNTVFSTGHSSQDLLYGEAVITANRRAPSSNRVTTYQVLDNNGRPRNDVILGEVYIADLSGGLDDQVDEVNNHLLSTNGIDGRFPRSLFLSPLVDSAATPDPSSILSMSAVDIFGTTAVGIGTSLLIPTSATNRDPTALTFTPNGSGSITYLYRGAAGGNGTQYLWVCNSAADAELLSDLGTTPTSAGSISSTNPCWGVVESPLNDDTPGAISHLMYIGKTIAIKPSDNTLTTAPTTVLSDRTGGGYPVHRETFRLGGKGRLSAFWVFPREHLTTSMLASGEDDVLGDVYYTNAEGTDPLPLSFPIPIRYAKKWRHGVVASDGRDVYWNYGAAAAENLHFGYEFEPVTEREYIIENIDTFEDRLLVWVAERNTSSDAYTRKAVYEYIPETDAWYQLTAWITATGKLAGLVTTGVAREHSTLYRNSTLYGYDGAAWRIVYMTPPTWNPFYMSNNTGSATAGVVYTFAASGTAKTPIWIIPGLEAFPSQAYEGQCLGDIRQPSGGGGAQVAVTVAHPTSSGMAFSSTPTWKHAALDTNDAEGWKKNRSRETSDVFNKLQLQFDITQATSGTGATRTSPNALPYIVRFVTFLDGVVKPISELNLP